MKRAIRRGVFETNSSSTHSICIVPAEDFEAWLRGELMFNESEEEFVPSTSIDPSAKITVNYWDEAARKYLTKEVADTPENREEYDYEDEDEDNWEDGPIAYQTWRRRNNDYETYTETKTINGVKVVAFGYYGYNG